MCTIASNAGFFNGLWDGIIAVFTLIASIFWNVNVFTPCAGSWYAFGFMVGFAVFGYALAEYWWPTLIIMGIVWLVMVVFGNIYVTLIVAGILALAIAWMIATGRITYRVSIISPRSHNHRR